MRDGRHGWGVLPDDGSAGSHDQSLLRGIEPLPRRLRQPRRHGLSGELHAAGLPVMDAPGASSAGGTDAPGSAGGRRGAGRGDAQRLQRPSAAHSRASVGGRSREAGRDGKIRERPILGDSVLYVRRPGLRGAYAAPGCPALFGGRRCRCRMLSRRRDLRSRRCLQPAARAPRATRPMAACAPSPGARTRRTSST